MKFRKEQAYWHGFLKAAEGPRQPSSQIAKEISQAPNPVSVVSNAVVQAAGRPGPEYANAVNTVSNLANQVRHTREGWTSGLASNMQPYVPMVDGSNLSGTQRKLLADLLVNRDRIQEAAKSKGQEVQKSVEALTPDLFKQTYRLEQELEKTTKPAREVVDQLKATTGYGSLMSGFAKAKKYDSLPWWKKMTGLHDSRPYLDEKEYDSLSSMAGDPALAEVVQEALKRPSTAAHTAMDIAQTPTMARSIGRLGATAVNPAVSSAAAQNWMSANAPILKQLTGPTLGRLASAPAAAGTASSIGGELGQLAGKASVNGPGEIPKYFNEEARRQNSGNGAGNFVLAAENNFHKPVATIYNTARALNFHKGPMSAVQNMKDYGPLLFPSTWQDKHPPLPLPVKEPRQDNFQTF